MNFGKLLLTMEQRQLIDTLYKSSNSLELQYDLNNSQQQQDTSLKLTELGLDKSSCDALESRWTVQYSDKWGQAQGLKRTLFQW